LTTLLKLANYEPVTTNFASDALQIARSDDFDLYILSRRFPVDSGVYLCQKLHKISPQTPIVFLSEQAGSLNRQESIRSGSDEYITKSKDAHEILDAVRHALSESKGALAAVN
ncbi:MAG: response regulator, partial [Pyrinomonadaceae bacterium]|nr:response regulator [Pyrinomonadaceae bacterium]